MCSLSIISTTYKLLLFSPASSSFSKFRVQNPRPSLSFPYHKPTKPPGLLLPVCEAKSRTAPLKKRSSSSSSSSSAKKKKKPTKGRGGVADLEGFEIVKSDVDGGSYTYDYDDGGDESSVRANANSGALTRHPVTPLPKPPAGFILDEAGKVVLASTKRIATIVDSSNNSPLDCVIRRIFRSSRGDECMLLCPVDTPVLIMKSVNVDGWSAVSDEEAEAILPAVAYALAKIHMHLVLSGFCYTARGGFCYSEDDIFDLLSDNDQDMDGLPNEGVEITCFNQDGTHYMIYTPSDPILFVAVKDQNGLLKIADDDLLEDSAITSAVDEETEFNALVEEEAALLESLMGKR